MTNVCGFVHPQWRNAVDWKFGAGDKRRLPTAMEYAERLGADVWILIRTSCDAGVDSDGDGSSNLQEFLSGTDPTKIASSFRITFNRSARRRCSHYLASRDQQDGDNHRGQVYSNTAR